LVCAVGYLLFICAAFVLLTVAKQNLRRVEPLSR
jgi:hypothetical protein